MDWELLISEDRKRLSTKVPGDSRSAYESDYDRVIHCSAFRRLQDKAQVFPLKKGDYVRTRLTHSLEVSTLGRSFGKDVSEKLAEKKVPYFQNCNFSKYDFSTIISSACLVHDFGNPPFGHFGENAIQEWYSKYLNNKNNWCINKQLSEAEKIDLLKFDGNAQGLRIAINLQYLIGLNGLNFTNTTLASMVKYPKVSNKIYKIRNRKIRKIDSKTDNVSIKKFGCFQSEYEEYSLIEKKLGNIGVRHPLAFLVEAADDIANAAADIEDACKKGVIKFEMVRKEFEDVFGKNDKIVLKIDEFYSDCDKDGYEEKESIIIQRFRLYLQGIMFRSCVDAFVNNYNSIMNGTYEKSLIDDSAEISKNIYKILIGIAKEYVYIDKDVVMMELIGNKVINGLLDIFVPTILSDQICNPKSEIGKYYSLISNNFRFIYNKTQKKMYNKLQLANDFISGMTDSFAFDLYQKLSGVKI